LDTVRMLFYSKAVAGSVFAGMLFEDRAPA
jgi:hypothetical protein